MRSPRRSMPLRADHPWSRCRWRALKKSDVKKGPICSFCEGTIIQTVTLAASSTCPALGSFNLGAGTDGASDEPDRIAMAPIDAPMDRVFVLCLGIKSCVYTACACGHRAGILLAAPSIRSLCRGRTRTARARSVNPRRALPSGCGRIACSSRICCDHCRRLNRRGCNIVLSF